MALPLVGLSLLPEEDYLKASYSLFDAGEVEVIEWSFDIGWSTCPTPDWANQLIDSYSRAGRLLGHGVSFSPLSVQWTERHIQWLKLLREELTNRKYLHISEHFGFMSAGSFHQGPPLPVPLTEDSLRIGRDRLQRLADVAKVPVGLENLAFAFGLRDVCDQGRFLNDLLSPVDGFLLLDIHNLYCQIHNFSKSALDILKDYPLDRVRELHISGGSWSGLKDNKGKRLRRDTHDGAVPSEVFQLIPLVLDLCPGVEAIILERLDCSLNQESKAKAFREDFYRLRKTVKDHYATM